MIDPVAATPIFLMNLFNRGPSVWGMTSRTCSLVPSYVRGQDGVALSDEAIDCKRRGEYRDSLNIYLVLIKESLDQLGYVSVSLMRGMYKTLICMNEYVHAWSIACTIFADMQHCPNPDPQHYEMFRMDFNVMRKLAIEVIDEGETSNLELLTKETSGSPFYRMQKTNVQIKAEFGEIRNQLRRNYGI